MSLINDALKKAQKQRAGETPALSSMPGVGGESATRIAKRARPAGFGSMVTRLGIGAAVVVVLIVGGIFIAKSFRGRAAPVSETVLAPAPAIVAKAEPTPASPEPAKASNAVPAPFVLPSTLSPPQPTPAPAVNPPVDTVAVTPGPAPIIPLQVEPKVQEPTPAPPPVVAPPPRVVAAQPAAVPEPPPVPMKATEPPPRLDSKAVNFIESLRIAGIRASATDSKVLMNDRVYRVGDIVEHDMGLKLTGITPSSLTFENDHGASYTRNF